MRPSGPSFLRAGASAKGYTAFPQVTDAARIGLTGLSSADFQALGFNAQSFTNPLSLESFSSPPLHEALHPYRLRQRYREKLLMYVIC